MLTILRAGSEGVDQAMQLRVGPRTSGEADNDRDDHARRPGDDRRPERLRQLARIGVHDAEITALDTGYSARRQRESMMNRGADGAGKQAPERAVPGGSTPEHAQRE